MIVINTPHNPVGKVFTRAELEQIAQIAEEHNLIVMSDEVVSPVIRLEAITRLRYVSCSTTPLCSTAASTSASPHSPGCGTARSQSAQQAVRLSHPSYNSSPFARMLLHTIMSDILHSKSSSPPQAGASGG